MPITGLLQVVTTCCGKLNPCLLKRCAVHELKVKKLCATCFRVTEQNHFSKPWGINHPVRTEMQTFCLKIKKPFPERLPLNCFCSLHIERSFAGVRIVHVLHG